jgi:uncharacterized FAD-dependent dehydrogenase
MIRLQQVLLPVGHTDEALRKAAASALRLDLKDLRSLRVHRQGVDARHSRQVRFVYTLDVEVADEAAVLRRGLPNVLAVADTPFTIAPPSAPYPGRPVIVGSGPAGLFAALALGLAGARPLILERGRPMDDRVRDVRDFMAGGRLDPESNVQFGEGGAGTFSDGKLNSSISDPRCRWVLERLVAAGAPGEILIKAKPHVGTDRIREAVKALRREIEGMGGEFRFGARVADLLVRENRVVGVGLAGGEEISAHAVVLAVGNAARDTFEMIHARGVYVEAKPFSIGARIEHARARLDRCLYGTFADHPRLGAADYKLAHHADDGRGAYTFCMCPGGVVVAGASEAGGVVTNGMSEFARDLPNSNSGLMVSVQPADFGAEGPLAGVTFQRHWERRAFAAGGGGFRAPVQRVEDFLARRPTTQIGSVSPTYLPGVAPADLWSCLPEFVARGIVEAIRVFDRRIKGFAHPDALLTGVETRSSSPVRIRRDETFQTNLRGLFPAGEGAGYAGGIMSSAVDGLRVAEAVVAQSKV